MSRHFFATGRVATIEPGAGRSHLGGMGDDPMPDTEHGLRARRRRGGLLNHLILFFAVMVVLVPVNFLTTPDYPWFVFPMVLWFAPLALHVAWAMGLFDRRG